MAQSADELIAAALALPATERERLLDAISESLNGTEDSADLSPELRDTITRRIDAMERGEVEGIPMDQVLARTQKVIDDVRAKKLAT